MPRDVSRPAQTLGGICDVGLACSGKKSEDGLDLKQVRRLCIEHKATSAVLGRRFGSYDTYEDDNGDHAGDLG